MKLIIETGENNAILRKKSSPIQQNEIKKYVKIGEAMVRYIRNPDNSGVGLAAPQIGINKKLIVVALMKTRDDEDFSVHFFMNPSIVDHSKEIELDEEGCLSLPDAPKCQVKRWEEVTLQYMDERWKEQRRIFKGFTARIIQHEVDHLEGILYIDRK